MRIKGVLIYLIAFVFAWSVTVCSAGAGQDHCDDFLSIRKRILTKLDEIKNYRFEAVVSMEDNVVVTQICGAKPNRLRIKQELNNGSKQYINTVVFDGKYQWVESRQSDKILQLSRIKLSKIVDKERPFDTGYYVYGAGIFAGEDFPSTVEILLSIYDLSAICSPDGLILSGRLNETKFEKYAATRKFANFNKEHGFGDAFKRSFRYAIMVFGTTDYVLRKYTLGPSQKAEKIKVTFNQVKINSGISGDEFIFHIPGGIEPNDITSELLQAFSE